MKKSIYILITAVLCTLSLAVGVLAGANIPTNTNSISQDDGLLTDQINDSTDVSNEDEYGDTVYDGYPSPDDENFSEKYDKWFADKCEVVTSAFDEVAFIYGKIIELDESSNGYVKVMIRPNDDNPPNYRDNAYFHVSERTLIRSGYWPGAMEMTVDSLVVGQKVCVAVCHVPNIPEVSPAALHAFAVIMLDGDPANPEPLIPDDYKYYEFEGEIEVEEAEIVIEAEAEEGILVEDPVE